MLVAGSEAGLSAVELCVPERFLGGEMFGSRPVLSPETTPRRDLWPLRSSKKLLGA